MAVAFVRMRVNIQRKLAELKIYLLLSPLTSLMTFHLKKSNNNHNIKLMTITFYTLLCNTNTILEDQFILYKSVTTYKHLKA